MFTDGEGLEEALDDAACEYLTTEGGERYPDGCSESRKRCIRKKAKCFVLEDGEMILSITQMVPGDVLEGESHPKKPSN